MPKQIDCSACGVVVVSEIAANLVRIIQVVAEKH